MEIIEHFLIFLGAAVCVFYGGKLLLFSRMLFPKRWFPLPETFFRSMGEWAVVTGSSEGIGRAYAVALAERGMNVVIMSRTKEKLDQLAEEIGEKTGRKVKVMVTDFNKDGIYGEIEEQLQDLNVGVLVNNIGVLPTVMPCKFLDTEELDTVITKVINCNVKTMLKMCRIVLPGMENRFPTHASFITCSLQNPNVLLNSDFLATNRETAVVDYLILGLQEEGADCQHFLWNSLCSVSTVQPLCSFKGFCGKIFSRSPSRI